MAEQVTENMEIAHRRDAVLSEKFYFRKRVFPPRFRGTRASNNVSPSPSRPSTPMPQEFGPVEDEYELMTIDEIINGQSGTEGFPGCIPLIESYLNSINVDVETRCELAQYLDLIRKRANGTRETAATWIRKFVRSHPDYKKDSVITQSINYDLVKAAEKLAKGEGKEEGLWKGLLDPR